MDYPENYIEDGYESEYLLSRVKPYLDTMQRRTIARLVSHHNTETLSDENMRSGIAMLAILDELPKELGRLIRLGKQDLDASRRYE